VSVKASGVGVMGAALLRALGRTWRARAVGRWHEQQGLEQHGAVLYAFWHGGILGLTYFFRERNIQVLVSEHADGEYITQVIHRLGFGTVRGSTTHGGFRSLLELARRGREGFSIAITPDGPRGPRRKAQAGVLLAAQKSGVPILPLAMAAWPRKRLDSWDRSCIPAPFARIVYGFGPPLRMPTDAKPEALIAEWEGPVEEAIDAISFRVEEEVRMWAGAPAIEMSEL